MLAMSTMARRHLMQDKDKNKTPESTPAPVSRPPTSASLSYCPGEFYDGKTSNDGMLLLSNGLSCNRIATTGQPVRYADGGSSAVKFHRRPDGAAVFEKDDGGWYYVSNSEVSDFCWDWYCGGVGAIEFDWLGNVVGYKRVANKMKQNCGGGKTPWNSWITCEEIADEDYIGHVYQVDPTGARDQVKTAMGALGSYESFAYDDSTAVPTFYVTRDRWNGVLTRFTPNAAGMNCYNQRKDEDRWCTLNNGDVDYLMLGVPGCCSADGEECYGNLWWTTDLFAAETNAQTYYRHSEGVDAADGKVFFVSKEFKRLVILDLASRTYSFHSTVSGPFSGQPDQVGRLVRDDESILYFCEDNGPATGVFGRAADGRYFTILEGRTDGKEDESTGLAWSPDGKHLLVTYQEGGYVYDCTRDDGLPFYGTTLDIKYHSL